MTPSILDRAVHALQKGEPDPDTFAHRAVLADIALRLPADAPDDAAWPEALRLERLLWLIATAQTTPMALDKLARWTGYVQGVACARGWLDADTERARTRPVFHAAAQAAGRAAPDSLGPEQG